MRTRWLFSGNEAGQVRGAAVTVFPMSLGAAALASSSRLMAWTKAWTKLVPGAQRASPFFLLLLAILLAALLLRELQWRRRLDHHGHGATPRPGRDADSHESLDHLLAALLANTSDLVYFKDLESRFLCTSKAHARRLDLEDPAQAVGKSDKDFYAADHAQDALKDEQKIIQTGLPVTDKEEKETYPDGRVTWVSTSKLPLRDASGKIVGTLGISRDISKRKRAEQELIAAHAEAELFINSVPSILIGDSQARIIRWNAAATATFGPAAEEVQGRPLWDCGIRWLDSGMAREIESWLHMRSAQPRDNVAFERHGEKRYLTIEFQTVRFSDAKGAGLLITGVDTTEQKKLESQLRQAQKLEAIGQLAAGIAHEINTPTQYITDNLTFLRESWPAVHEAVRLAQKIGQELSAGAILPATLEQLKNALLEADLEYTLGEVPRAVEQSLEGTRRITEIVRAMKAFSHPGSSEKRLEDLNKAIETTITVARNEWKYVADVVTHFDTNLPPVPCLLNEFNQVILNLIVNAAYAIKDHHPEGGKGVITVTTRTAEQFAEVLVSDSGGGIPEPVRSRIFEPFFTTKGVGKGTGQGLAMAHNVIVKKHAGAIWFESEVGKGTTFFLRLPLEQARKNQENARANAATLAS